MKYLWIVLATAFMLTGCGHKQLDYRPAAPAGMDRQQAISAVEQGFYEDFSKTRPESIEVTEQFIVLSDGIVSKGSSFGSAAPIVNGAIAAGTSTVTTKLMGQRLYFNSMGSINLYQKKFKSGRFAVIIRAADGSEMRAVRLRSLEKAKRFADALEYLRTTSRR
jgi:PBP1b-binding outer membrane lipoprotein LpoB